MAAALKKTMADVALITAPDAVCWLLNIRGRDVENTPLALAVALVDDTAQAQLFVDRSLALRCARGGASGQQCGIMRPENAGTMPDRIKRQTRVLCDPASAPVWFTQVLENAGAKIVAGKDPCLLPKGDEKPGGVAGHQECPYPRRRGGCRSYYAGWKAKRLNAM